MFAKKSLQQLVAHLSELGAGAASSAGVPYGIEPMTAVTDGIMALVTIFLAAWLFAHARGRKTVSLWAWAFVAMAGAAFTGALYHSIRVALPMPGPSVLWKIVPVTTGAAMFFFGCAAATAWLRRPRVAIVLLAVQFAACVALTVKINAFWVAVADAGPVLLALLIGALAHRARWIAAGVIVTGVAAGVQAMKALQLGPFDHNDLFHLIQIAAMALLYRGGLELGVTDPSRA